MARPDRPLVIAHRGSSGHRPENTRPAFALAVEQRADMIETDLHVTRDGVVVLDLHPSGPAARAGILPGDRLVAVAGRDIDRTSQAARAVRAGQRGDPVTVQIERDGTRHLVEVPPAAGPAGDQLFRAKSSPEMPAGGTGRLLNRARPSLRSQRLSSSRE